MDPARLGGRQESDSSNKKKERIKRQGKKKRCWLGLALWASGGELGAGLATR